MLRWSLTRSYTSRLLLNLAKYMAVFLCLERMLQSAPYSSRRRTTSAFPLLHACWPGGKTLEQGNQCAVCRLVHSKKLTALNVFIQQRFSFLHQCARSRCKPEGNTSLPSSAQFPHRESEHWHMNQLPAEWRLLSRNSFGKRGRRDMWRIREMRFQEKRELQSPGIHGSHEAAQLIFNNRNVQWRIYQVNPGVLYCMSSYASSCKHASMVHCNLFIYFWSALPFQQHAWVPWCRFSDVRSPSLPSLLAAAGCHPDPLLRLACSETCRWRPADTGAKLWREEAKVTSVKFRGAALHGHPSLTIIS